MVRTITVERNASITPTLVGIENGLGRSTGSGTSHINQIGIPGSSAHGKSDSHQIYSYK